MAETILIVDDSEDSRVLLERVLRRAGFETDQAQDGEQALLKVRSSHPALILLDVNMPGIDGFETCRRLKAQEDTADIPIIFVSARDDTTDKVRGLELGGEDYITKPYDKAEVLARVKSHLKIRRLTHQLQESNQELRKKQALIEEDLRAAAAIQVSLLPQRLPNLPGVDLAWDFTPCQQLGGDIFNVLLVGPGLLRLYMLDVSGHGVPASLVTVAVHETLAPQGGVVLHEGDGPGQGPRLADPCRVLQNLDGQYPLERFGKTFSIVYALLDIKSGTLSYASAGHPQPVLLRASGEVELLEPTGPLVGMGQTLPFGQEQRQLLAGDRLVLYTDGVTDYENQEGEFFGLGRFLEVLKAGAGLTLAGNHKLLRQAMESFGRGNPPQDDISLLALDFLG